MTSHSASPSAPPRYRPKGDNKLLAFALWSAWRMACYWCEKPLEFADVQIDHIAPESKFEELRSGLEIPSASSVHDVDNLAPICVPCNTKRKRGHSFTSKLMASWRAEATRRIGEVTTLYCATANRNKLTRELATISQAPSEPKTDALLEVFAPAIVGRLALVSPTLTKMYYTRDIHVLKPELAESYALSLSLGSDERADVEYALRFTGENLVQAMLPMLDETLAEVEEEHVLPSMQVKAPGAEDLGEVLKASARLSMSSIDVKHGDDSDILSTVEIEIEALFNAAWYGYETDENGALISADGEAVERQVDSHVMGTITLVIHGRWLDGYSLESWHADLEVDSWLL